MGETLDIGTTIHVFDAGSIEDWKSQVIKLTSNENNK